MKTQAINKSPFTATSTLICSKNAPKDLERLGKKLESDLKNVGGDNISHNINVDFNGILINGLLKNEKISSLFETPVKAFKLGFKEKITLYKAKIIKADI